MFTVGGEQHQADAQLKNKGVDTGNFIYAKIEGKSRKTDMFMALVASVVIEPVLGDGMPVSAPPIGAIRL